MKTIFLFTFLLMLVSCKQEAHHNQETERLKADLKTATIALDSITKLNIQPTVSLVHIVCLSLKSPEDEAALSTVLSEIRKLKEIPQVHNLNIGTFHDFEDPRAMSEYEVVFQMGFKDDAAYNAYQADPIHLALKKTLGEYLDSPPVTYDYMLR